MKRWLGVATVLALALALSIALASRIAPTEISETELARRVAGSVPQWADYQEELKAHLGATPVARWQGEPIRAVVEGREVRVTFAIRGVWARYDFALPVLLRSHLGKVYVNRQATRRASEVTYIFQLIDLADGAATPWVEIRYPHRERRLLMSPEGTWRADPR